MSLFNSNNNRNKPLSELCRPENLDELYGQKHIWSPSSPLYKLVESATFHALLLWGPPGTGKTSLARLISKKSGFKEVSISAVSTTLKELRAAIEESSSNIKAGLNPTILFVDEIHRLNKGQQDVLLPSIEAGDIKFIGATTENPSFEVNKAILSRCLTFRFNQITIESMTKLLTRAVKVYNEHTGLSIETHEEAIKELAAMGSGDARYTLNLLEAGLSLVGSKAEKTLKKSHLEELGIDLTIGHDKKGDSHYDLASALIKSIRASHPDASLYYLARLIEGGEDPMFIARRLLISSSEDIGNANPTALTLATSAMQAVQMIGMPEARIVLSQLTTYLASSPKSNRSYEAIGNALSTVKKTGSLPIPDHLKNAPTEFMKAQGNSQGYIYPHHDAGYRNLTYLPKPLAGTRFYHPSNIGTEAKFVNLLSANRPQKD